MPTYMYDGDLVDVLKKKHASGTYKSLVFYLEACEYGSIFDGLLPEAKASHSSKHSEFVKKKIVLVESEFNDEDTALLSLKFHKINTDYAQTSVVLPTAQGTTHTINVNVDTSSPRPRKTKLVKTYLAKQAIKMKEEIAKEGRDSVTSPKPISHKDDTNIDAHVTISDSFVNLKRKVREVTHE
ncbi:hypothetical protein AgCh_024832 [Apium graveolens]